MLILLLRLVIEVHTLNTKYYHTIIQDTNPNLSICDLYFYRIV